LGWKFVAVGVASELPSAINAGEARDTAAPNAVSLRGTKAFAEPGENMPKARRAARETGSARRDTARKRKKNRTDPQKP